MFELLLTGLYLGLIHIFSAPDHIATILPLSLLDKRKSWKVGLNWGLGHLIGLFALGILLYFFRSLFNFDFFEHNEILYHYIMPYIAVVLILVGYWTIYKSRKIDFSHPPKHHKHLSKITLGTGIIHGLAGFSHIYTLAPTLSMNDFAFFSYFGGFASGSIVSAVLFTYLVCFIPERITANTKRYQRIIYGFGMFSMIMGFVLLFNFFRGGSLDFHHFH